MANRLAQEASPYLQQHANNPVDWYPWGEEALARAKREDKPILLSVGYSACHWCHVMEHESFSDEAIAKLMNERFVNIKVDREERPDLDQIYQVVVQLLGRSGGWPLTVFLTPDQEPFFGGTYFPNRERYGMPSFRRVLETIADAYASKREEVASQAGEITAAIQGVLGAAQKQGETAITPELLPRAVRALSARFDDRNGGFGDRPKFPNPTALELLALSRDDRSRERYALALDKMRAGGIWDHLGGGFHRYSTDAIWLVPHFEKMLYDNALLLRAYVEGWRLFRKDAYAETARGIVRWLEREMTDGGGGFYSASDADSEGEEGKFFAWTLAEVRAAAGEDAEIALASFGVTEEGNFEGKNVLFAASEPGDRARLEAARERMWRAREARPKPFRDEKILTSWNALAVGALADASMTLGEPAWLTLAARAYEVVHARGGLARMVKDGARKGEAFLDDHAYLANAALDLHEATGEARYLEDARALADLILLRFHDPKEGGFFFASSSALIVRAKDTYDSAVPSGSASALRALLRLGAIVDARYEEVAARELERVASAALENPFGFAHLIVALDRLARGSTDVVLVGGDPALAKAAFERPIAHRNIVWILDERSSQVAKRISEGKQAHGAYVCRGRTCSLPTSSPKELAHLLHVD